MLCRHLGDIFLSSSPFFKETTKTVSTLCGLLFKQKEWGHRWSSKIYISLNLYERSQSYPTNNFSKRCSIVLGRGGRPHVKYSDPFDKSRSSQFHKLNQCAAITRRKRKSIPLTQYVHAERICLAKNILIYMRYRAPYYTPGLHVR